MLALQSDAASLVRVKRAAKNRPVFALFLKALEKPFAKAEGFFL
jgi:hypothetical protein